MKKQRWEKVLAGFLCMVLMISMLSMTVLADDVNQENHTDVIAEDGVKETNMADEADIEDPDAAVEEEDVEDPDAAVEEEGAEPDAAAEEEGAEEPDVDTENDIVEPEMLSAEESLQRSAANSAHLTYLTYSGHVQNIGNQAAVSDGAVCGTEGKSLRVEALTIEKGSALADIEGDITYRVHVQNYGTMGWVTSGKRAGTSGQSLRVEAVQIALTGELAEIYDIYYSAHIQNYGWMKWTKGTTEQSGWCGSMGFGLRMEAIRIVLVEKGAEAPSGGGNRSFISSSSFGNVNYMTHQQNIGDHAWTSNQKTSGVTGQSLRLEAMRITLSDTAYTGSVQYRSHVQNIGWTDWAADGGLSGTSGQSLRMEAVQIRLTGEIANYCDIWYRVHVQNFGWMGWAVNGQEAGSVGLGYRAEAIEIALVPKGAQAPGVNANYVAKWAYSGEMYNAWCMAQNMSSRTNYLIMVDNTACRTFIFQGGRGNWTPLYDWVCSPGKASTPTVKGYYTVGARGWSFGESEGFSCYYWTQFYGDYLFHSILYYANTMIPMEPELGAQLSHGCVRLDINNAKWIYDNIPTGTLVYSY